MDRSIGRLLDAIEQSSRGENTLLILVGDHGQPNGIMAEQQTTNGLPGPGNSWTFLMFAGNGIESHSTRPEQVSHVDVAPSILHRIGIKAPNHFVGHSLFAPLPERGLFTYFFNGAAYVTSEFRYHYRLDNEDFQKTFPNLGVPEFIHPFEVLMDYTLPNEIKINTPIFSQLREAGKGWALVLNSNRLMP